MNFNSTNNKPTNNPTNSNKNFNDFTKEIIIARNKSLHKIRFSQAIPQLRQYPFKAIPLIMLVVTFICVYTQRNKIISSGKTSQIFQPFASQYGVPAIIIFVFTMLFASLLYAVGIPIGANSIEKKVERAMKQKLKYPFIAPILVSVKRRKNLYTYEFYSEDIKLDIWREYIEDITHKLKHTLSGTIDYSSKHSNNKHYIMFSAKKGIKNLTDPKLHNDIDF